MKKEPDDLKDVDDYLKSYLPSNLLEKDKKLYQIGIRKIFLHKPLCRYLRLNLQIKKVVCVVKVQSYVRGFLERSRYIHMKKAVVLIQSIYRMYTVRKIYQPLLETEVKFVVFSIMIFNSQINHSIINLIYFRMILRIHLRIQMIICKKLFVRNSNSF